MNHYFEWAEDDQGGRTEIQGLPRDDVLESLKRKEVAAGEGTSSNGVSFRETVIKTITEYQKILDAKVYKDQDDKRKLEKTIKDLKRQLEDL